MTTIYVLTAGEYSDYRIVALYSTLELAQAAQKHCPDSCIKEYELDSVKIPEHPPGYTGWHVNINAETNSIKWSYQADVLGVSHPFISQENYFDDTSVFIVKCWARDEEHAQKIALGKFYQWKYEREMGFLENDTEAQ